MDLEVKSKKSKEFITSEISFSSEIGEVIKDKNKTILAKQYYDVYELLLNIGQFKLKTNDRKSFISILNARKIYLKDLEFIPLQEYYIACSRRIKSKKESAKIYNFRTEKEDIFYNTLIAFTKMEVWRSFIIGIYSFDFYIPRLGIAIEIDGDYHNKEGKMRKDSDRINLLQSFGIKLISFQNEQVKSSDVVLNTTLVKLAKMKVLNTRSQKIRLARIYLFTLCANSRDEKWLYELTGLKPNYTSFLSKFIKNHSESRFINTRGIKLPRLICIGSTSNPDLDSTKVIKH